jgi:hypothetical protein
MYFDLPPEVKELGVSQLQLTTQYLIVHNGKVNVKSHYFKNDLQKTLTELKDKMLTSGHFGDGTTVDKITLLISNVWVDWEEKSKKEQVSKDKDQEKGKRKREFLVYKYSNRKKGDLHEGVILGGKPAFLKYTGGSITCIEKIEEGVRTIKPPYLEHYPYEPYEYESMNEIISYVERARGATIDSLFLQAKQIATDYNDQNKDKIILLAMEIIWSYFQDKFPTTHYDIVLGGNGSGKSSYGITFGASGYRVVNLTSPNAANINRILGCIEVGQCTIISDETGALDKNEDLMSLLKNGYDSKGKTSKINDFSREPEFFYAYCFKMIISERMPNLRNARGVLDRSFSFTTYKGCPKYDIKETLEPQGNPARQERLDALNDFRKLMLIYRLLHFKDPIPDINVGVEGREKELSKPVVQLFYGANAQKEIETTLQAFLNLRNEKKEITLEPILHPIISNLVSEHGNEISVKQIWGAIKETIEGYCDEKRPHEYQTLEYGTIYNNTISSILEHTFGGRPKHKEHGNVFLFDPEELLRIGRAYSLTTTIQVTDTDPEGSEGNEGSTEVPPCSNANQDTNSRVKTDDAPTKDSQKQGGAHRKEPSEPSCLQGQVIEGYSCRYCEFKTDTREHHDHHTVLRHPRKAGY